MSVGTQPRWERLFADLEGQLAAQELAALRVEVVERSRAAIGELRLVDRYRAAIGHRVTFGVHGAGPVTGELRGVGGDWVLVAEAPGGETLLAVPAVGWVRGLRVGSAEPGTEGAVASRLTLRHLLRGLVKDRCGIELVLRDGARVQGTPDRVGNDYLEVAEHPLDEARRVGNVLGVRTVPLAAITVVRRA